MLNATPLAEAPLTLTTRFPLVELAGTWATMLLPLQLVTWAATPLKVTELEPCAAPKLAPVIVTAVPAIPVDGDTLLMFGETVKETALLANPLTVTSRLPLVAPA